MMGIQKTLLLFLTLVSVSCTSTRQGAVAGGVIGGVTGALIDSSNPWRGGLIGGVIGTVAGATIAEISKKGAEEAASYDQSVEYRSEDGRVYRADVIAVTRGGRCKRIRERVWNNGKLVQEQIREVCYSNGYWRY